MGILNVTPDSFAGDSISNDVGAVVARARDFVAAGADLLDIGGESTRPNASPVDATEELARALPAVRAVCATPAGDGNGAHPSPRSATRPPPHR